MFNEHISINNNFQYSVNLWLDINDTKKINSFIPTNESIKIIKELLQSILYKNSNLDTANLLIGPYGKGKSHLLLVVLSIINGGCNDQNRELVDKLILKDSEFEDLINKFSNKRYLPVILNSNYSDLKNSILFAIKNSLKIYGLESLTPNTYYSSAVEYLHMWKKSEEGSKRLNNELENLDIDCDELEALLIKYDNDALDIFKQIYKTITLGAKFEPLIQTDIVFLIKSICEELKSNYHYDGIYIVMDEFNKFLESGIDKNIADELALLQGIAELSSRSDINITCITHKPIGEYTYKLPLEKISNWKAIEGRFKSVYFTDTSRNSYELIEHAINKDDKINEIYSNTLVAAQELFDSAAATGMYEPDLKKTIVYGCFPLNPYSTYSLLRLNEKIAQNERTLFTFLSKEDKGSFVKFINDNNKELLSVDILYDYFKRTFAEEALDQRIHKIYVKTNSVLDQLHDELEIKVVKVLCVLLVVNDSLYLSPTIQNIKKCLNNNEEVIEAVQKLENKSCILRKHSNDCLMFLPGSGVNINSKINDIKESKVNSKNLFSELERLLKVGYITPKEYNYKNFITRYFKRKVIKIEDLLKINFELELNSNNSDGIIYYVAYDSKEGYRQVKQKISDINIDEKLSKRIIFVVPKHYLSVDETLKEIVSIEYLMSDINFLKTDPFIKKELEIFYEDRIEKLQRIFEGSFENYAQNEYINDGTTLQGIKSSKDFNKTLSRICFDVYTDTPVFKSELINKTDLQAPILKARNLIINHIISDSGHEFTVSKNSAEATLYRVLVKNFNFDSEYKSNDEKINKVIRTIENYVIDQNNIKKSFIGLYKILQEPPFGLRRGIIPIYISCILSKYKEYLVIYFEDDEVQLSLNNINRINDNPEKFSVCILPGSNGQIEYLNNLQKIFDEYNMSDNTLNRFDNIVFAMQLMMKQMPKYCKEFSTTYDENGKAIVLDSKLKTIRQQLLRPKVNSRELLMDMLPNLYNGQDYRDIVKDLYRYKSMIVNHINNTKKYLINCVKNILAPDYNGELSGALVEWNNSLDNESKKYITNRKYNSLIKLSSDFSNQVGNYDESFIINKIASIFTGLIIEDWNELVLQTFIQEINSINEEINKVVKNKDKIENFEITLKSNDSVNQKFIQKKKLSSYANSALEDIYSVIEDEYGNSISNDDKLNILLNLLNRYL